MVACWISYPRNKYLIVGAGSIFGLAVNCHLVNVVP